MPAHGQTLLSCKQIYVHSASVDSVAFTPCFLWNVPLPWPWKRHSPLHPPQSLSTCAKTHPRHARKLPECLNSFKQYGRIGRMFDIWLVRGPACTHQCGVFISPWEMERLSATIRPLRTSVGSLQWWRWAARPTLRTSPLVPGTRLGSHFCCSAGYTVGVTVLCDLHVRS